MNKKTNTDGKRKNRRNNLSDFKVRPIKDIKERSKFMNEE